MTRDDKEIVTTLRLALAEKVGQERFDLWFGAGVCLRLDGSAMVVAASDQFILDRLRKHFRNDVLAVCQQVLGEAPSIEFRVDASLAGSKPRGASSGAAAPVPERLSTPSGQLQVLGSGNGSAPARRRFANLDSFVVGVGNRVAHAAAWRAVQRLGALSPLFIYGATGTGKTHLLEGVWTAARQDSRLRRIVYLSAEQFTTYFLEALRGSGLPNFRRKYRDVELLLIDDVQFFVGKRATLVELQHTVDTLLREGRQLVLAADRSPHELTGLGPELTARMSGGLVCGIEPPDRETRVGIVCKLAERNGVAVPREVIELIAAQLSGDARQLAGAWNRIQATAQALEQPITLELAELAVKDIFQATQRMVQLPDIERAVCDVFGLEPRSLKSSRKAKVVSHPRMLAMWLARKYTRAAFSEIGHYFGRRSHSTVISAQKKVARWMSDGAPIELVHGSCKIDDAIRRVEARLKTG